MAGSRCANRWALYHVLVLLPALCLSDSSSPTAGSTWCGNGRLEAHQTTGTGCPGVSTVDPVSSIVAEACDLRQNSRFGISTSSCSTTCQFDEAGTAEPFAFVKADEGPALALQHASLAPIKQANADYVRMCMYSTQWVDSACNALTSYEGAAGCMLSAADFEKIPSLECYHMDDKDDVHHKQHGLCVLFAEDPAQGMSVSQLQRLGTRDPNSPISHKCIAPFETAGDMTAAPESWVPLNLTLHGVSNTHKYTKAGEEWPNMHDFCFSFDEPSYGSVTPGTQKLAPSKYTVDYKIICDPLDQKELTEATSVFGQRANVCSHTGDTPWGLVVCNEDDTLCTPITADLRDVYKNPNNPSDESLYGSVFAFDHEKNFFECDVNTLTDGTTGQAFTELPPFVNTCPHASRSATTGDGQAYTVGCKKRLKLHLQHGFGAVYFRIETTISASPSATENVFSAKKSEIVGFSIQATVDPVLASFSLDDSHIVEPNSVTGAPLTGRVPLFVTNPFLGKVQRTTSVNTKFSATAMWRTEYTDCTDSTKLVAAEEISILERFAIFDQEQTQMNYLASSRTYYRDADFGELAELHNAFHELRVRTNKPWHNAYTNGSLAADTGLCVKMRLTVYEPSSCDTTSVVSEPALIRVLPLQIAQSTGSALAVRSAQEAERYEEGTVIPLQLHVDYPGLSVDSSLFHFSHLTIEDRGLGNENETFAGDFDLFNDDGMNTANQSQYSDTVRGYKYIVKPTRTDSTWTTYSNAATMWLANNPAHSWGSLELEAHLGALASSSGRPCGNDTTVSLSQECLTHARTTGAGLFAGLFLRHRAGGPTNVQFRVTVYAIDGPSTGVVYDSASELVQFSFLPRPDVRMDHHEMEASPVYLHENGAQKMLLRAGALGVPTVRQASYTDGGTPRDVELCIYVGDAQSGQADRPDVSDPQYQNLLCSSTDGRFTTQAGDTEFGAPLTGSDYIRHRCPHRAGYRLTCEKASNNEFTESRIKLHELTISDKSTFDTPGGHAYQPAGNNRFAFDGQWYRAEACASSASIQSIHWCDDNANAGRKTTGLPTGAQPVQSQLTDAASCLSASSSRNFWQVSLHDGVRSMAMDEICIRGLSDFNTEQTGLAQPVRLELAYSVHETVVLLDGSVYTSTSSTTRGVPESKIPVTFESVREHAASSVVPGGKSWVMERPSIAEADSLRWAEVGIALAPGVADCAGDKKAFEMCLDRLLFSEEVSNFGDQFMGRMEIKCQVRSTRGDHAWEPAGGMFAAIVVDAGDVTQEEGYFGGAIDAKAAYRADDLRSQCAIDATQNDTVRQSGCTFATDPHTVAHWNQSSAAYYNRVMVDGGRYWSTNVDLRVPPHWKNIEYNCSVTAGNEDREHLPDKCLAHNKVWEKDDPGSVCPARDHTSVTRHIVFAVNETSHLPYLFIENSTSTQTDRACTGYPALPNCLNKGGVKAQPLAVYKTPEDHGSAMNPHNQVSHEMTSFSMVANRLFRVRVVVGSFGTDHQADFGAPVDGVAEYYGPHSRVYDAQAARLGAIGSRAYLTIESKHKFLTTRDQTDTNMNFCVWVCPLGTPSCDTDQLIRYKPLPDSVDMSSENSNSDKYDASPIQEEQSSPIPHTCPEDGAGSRYSIACAENGRCHELEDIYISYPQSETKDDLLEFTAMERGDSRGPSHWKHVKISAYIYMTPSVHAQQATLDAGWLDGTAYDPSSVRSLYTTDDRVPKFRLVMKESDFALNGIEFPVAFGTQQGRVTKQVSMNMSTAKWPDYDKLGFCEAADAIDCLVYPYGEDAQAVHALNSGQAVVSSTIGWEPNDLRSASRTVSLTSVPGSPVWNNVQCEQSKQMLMRLRTTSGDANSASGFVLVTVTDDDFYGQVRMAQCTEALCTTLNELHQNVNRNVRSNVSWEGWSNVHIVPRFQVQRTSSSEDGPVLRAAVVIVTIDTVLRPMDWEVVTKDEATNVETTTRGIDLMPGRDDRFYELHVRLPEYSCTTDDGSCDAMQQVTVSFKSTGRVDTCGVLGASDVKFSISDVLDGQATEASQVVPSCPRMVLPYSNDRNASITVTMESLHANDGLQSEQHPWALNFDSISESHTVSSYPAQYDREVKNTIVIEEAESMFCTKPEDVACASRMLRMPLCLHHQTSLPGATGAMSGPIGTFVVGLEDGESSVLSIGDNYQLRCEATSSLQTASGVDCQRISKLGYNDTDANGDGVIKTLLCDDDFDAFVQMNAAHSITGLTEAKHEHYCKQQPTWLQYHFSTPESGGHDLQCGSANTKPHFELTVFSVAEKHMSYDVNVVMRNRPDTDGAATCSSFETPSLKLKVMQHSPIFVDQGYKMTETHVTEWESTVVHDISNGRFSFAVADQYATTPEDETTFVNHGFGECPEAGASWERTDVNWMVDGASIQGTCDSLDLGALRAAVTDPSNKIGSFRELFGELKTALTAAEYNNTDVDLASPLAYRMQSVPGINRGMQRGESPGSAGGAGYKLTTDTTLGAIQACKTYANGNVLEVVNDGETTTYSFYAHVSKITAQHAGNAGWAAHTTRCSQRKYVFSASNTIAAITGLSTPGADGDKVYVHQMGHSKSPGVCASADACDPTIGAMNSCRADSLGHLEAFEYTVHIDRKVIVQKNSLGNDIRMHFAVSETDYATDILVSDDNCYGTRVKSVKVSYPVNEAGDTDMDLVRSSITFVTGCQDLRDDTGLVTDNAFSTCRADPARGMDFSFNASLYACSSSFNLVRAPGSATTPADPKLVSTCTTVNAQPYSMVMEYNYKPTQIETSATQTLSTFVFRGEPHNRQRTEAQIGAWKAQNKLMRGTATIAEGEQVNIAMCTTGAEDVSTLKLSEVTMATSKAGCLLAPYTTQAMVAAGWPACTKDNMLHEQTHSPFVFYAFGVALDGSTPCSTVFSGGAHCQPKQLSSNASNPFPSYGLMDEQMWENFINLELQCIHGSAQQNSCAPPTAEYQALFSGSVFSQQIVGMSPFKNSAQKLMVGGVLTNHALAIHGDAKAQVSTEQFALTSLGYDGSSNTQTVTAVYPEANGVCKCSTDSASCPWTFLERTARGTVSSTCDVWHMNLPSFRKGERYVFSLVAEQRQIGGGGVMRRLLATVGDQESANPFDVSGFDVASAKVGQGANATDSSDDDDWKHEQNSFLDYFGVFDDRNMKARSVILYDNMWWNKHSSDATTFGFTTFGMVVTVLLLHKILLVWLLLLELGQKDNASKKPLAEHTDSGDYGKLMREGDAMHVMRILQSVKSYNYDGIDYPGICMFRNICFGILLGWLELMTGSYSLVSLICNLPFFFCVLKPLMNNAYDGTRKSTLNPDGTDGTTMSWTMMHKTEFFKPKDGTPPFLCRFGMFSLVCVPIVSSAVPWFLILNTIAMVFNITIWTLIYFFMIGPEKEVTKALENVRLMMAEPASATEGKFYIP